MFSYGGPATRTPQVPRRYSSYIQSPPVSTGSKDKGSANRSRRGGQTSPSGWRYGSGPAGSPTAVSPPYSSYLRKLEFNVNNWAAATTAHQNSRRTSRSRSPSRPQPAPARTACVSAQAEAVAATGPSVSGTATTQPAGFLRRYQARGVAAVAGAPAASRVTSATSSSRETAGPAPSGGAAMAPSAAAAAAEGRTRQANDNVMVVVRVRPMLLKEMKRHQLSVVEVAPPSTLLITRLADRSNPYLRSGKGARYDYSFDAAFGPECSQHEVWERTASPLVDTVMEGTNATIFVYGATGTGKTYTMMGTDKVAGAAVAGAQPEDRPPVAAATASASAATGPQPGIVSLTLRCLFERIRVGSAVAPTTTMGGGGGAPPAKRWTTRISYLEIYNEKIRDLLSPSARPLSLRENPALGFVHVANLTEAAVSTEAEILELLRAGNCRRRVEPTSANRVSSRSHAILQVQVTCFEYRHHHPYRRAGATGIGAGASGAGTMGGVAAGGGGGGGGEPVKAAMLSMIDLAGSERAATTHNRGLRLKEGANINRSLLALANCINALAVNGNRAAAHRRRRGGGAGGVHMRVKYRDSKLTHILKNSLEGNCRVVMIANLSPAHSYFEESLNTLKYASRARNIRIRPTAHVVDELPPQPHHEYLLRHGGEYGALDSDDDDDDDDDDGARGGDGDGGHARNHDRGGRARSGDGFAQGRRRRRGIDGGPRRGKGGGGSGGADPRSRTAPASSAVAAAAAAAAAAEVAAAQAAANSEIERMKRHYGHLHRSLQHEVEERLARKEAEKEAERGRWEPRVRALQRRVVELEAENARLRAANSSSGSGSSNGDSASGGRGGRRGVGVATVSRPRAADTGTGTPGLGRPSIVGRGGGRPKTTPSPATRSWQAAPPPPVSPPRTTSPREIGGTGQGHAGTGAPTRSRSPQQKHSQQQQQQQQRRQSQRAQQRLRKHQEQQRRQQRQPAPPKRSRSPQGNAARGGRVTRQPAANALLRPASGAAGAGRPVAPAAPAAAPPPPPSSSASPPRISFNFRKLAALGQSPSPSVGPRGAGGRPKESFFAADFDTFRQKLGAETL